MDFATEVKQALEQHFNGADASGVTYEPLTERVGGLIIWAGFAPMTHLERQRAISAFLRQAFGVQTTRIGMIFSYAPNEYDLMQAA